MNSRDIRLKDSRSIVCGLKAQTGDYGGSECMMERGN
jgi:hypothetical protein